MKEDTNERFPERSVLWMSGALIGFSILLSPFSSAQNTF